MVCLRMFPNVIISDVTFLQRSPSFIQIDMKIKLQLFDYVVTLIHNKVLHTLSPTTFC